MTTAVVPSSDDEASSPGEPGAGGRAVRWESARRGGGHRRPAERVHPYGSNRPGPEGASSIAVNGDFFLRAGPCADRYWLVRPLGEGSAVYEAFDTRLRRRIAVKVRPLGTHGGAECVRRSLQEARAAGSLSHRNVVAIYDFRVDGEQTFLVMELVDGPTLEQKLRDGGPLGLRRTVETLLPVLSGVAALHEARVIHGGIEAASILLSGPRAEPKLTGFKLSRLAHRVAGAPADPGARTPEDGPDERTDQRAVAAVAYECLTGAQPGPGASPPSAFDSTLGAVDEVVMRALRPDPADRYPSVAAFAEALAAAADADLRRPARAVVACSAGMSTKAERARSRAERSKPPKPKKPYVAKGSRARSVAAEVTNGGYAGGVTATRNVKGTRGDHPTHGLEGSATGRPTRKSTRKGANRVKPDSQLRRRVMRQSQSPEARAARA